MSSAHGSRSRPPGTSIRLRLQALLTALIALVAGSLVVVAAHSMLTTLVDMGSSRAQDASARVASVLEQSARRSRALATDVAGRSEIRALLAADGAGGPEASESLAAFETGVARRVSVWRTDGSVVLERAIAGAPGAAVKVEDLPPVTAMPAGGFSVVQDADGIAFSDLTVPVFADGRIGTGATDGAGVTSGTDGADGVHGTGEIVGRLSVRAPLLLNPPRILRSLVGDDATILLGSASGAWTDFERILPAPPVAGEHEYRRQDGTEQLGGATDIPGTPWIVWVEIPKDSVTAPAGAFIARLTTLALIVSVIALVVADLAARTVVTRPLRRLTAAAQGIASGDYAQRVEPDRTAEIGALCATFNAMAERIESDIEARRQAELALSDREAHFRVLFEANPLPMWVYDLNTLDFLEVNDAAQAHYGFSRDQFLSMKITDIRPPEEVPRLLTELAAPRDVHQKSGVWKHRVQSGRVIDVEITSHSLNFGGREAAIIVAQDVTERGRLEAQLRQAQKLEAVGNLAGGVAHDFNNVLTVILGFTQMLRESPGMSEEHRSDLVQIEKAAGRARTLTHQLLAFARRQILQPRVFDVNAAIAEAARLLRKLIPENVELTIPSARPGARILMDPAQLEQILINLAVNASDAMPKGGKLVIETSAVTLDEHYKSRHLPVIPGRYVLIAVSDTGTGMDEETAKQAFEPFFTTKGVGKGTGLGLATVHGIVKQSGGDVWLYSEPGRGTTFKIFLPEASGEAGGAVETHAAADAPPGGGSETILVVEDDEAVRALVRLALQRAGYRVLEAIHPKDAVRVVSEHSGRIDLLLSDVIMPESDGPALHGRLLATHPDLAVLYMSGYADEAIVQQGILAEGAPFIQKPFSPRTLARKVREVLDSGLHGHPDA